MTVCVAARCGNIVIAACNRMLTAGDVQFETPAAIKIQHLSNLAFIMTAGDAALAAEMVYDVGLPIRDRIIAEPNNVWKIKEIIDLYINKYNQARMKKSEAQILAPLGLDRNSFISSQSLLQEKIVSDISKELINYDMPSSACIITGVDPTGAHVYTIRGDQYTCDDGVDFSAIGIGARHALSQLMLVGQSYDSSLADTVLAVYNAKKRSEIAPGVGTFTEMVSVGGGAGLASLSKEAMDKLEEEYQKIFTAEREAFVRGRKEVNHYVEELTKKAAESGGGGVPQETADSVGGT